LLGRPSDLVLKMKNQSGKKTLNLSICFAVAGITVASLLSGCAFLHHVTVGDIDNRKGYTQKPIEFKVSETGVDLKDVKTMADIFMRNQHAQSTKEAAGFIESIQMGPRTGHPVYNLAAYSDLNQKLKALCPSGRITGILAIRETRKYPVISGEIIKVKAYCLEPKA
jgi:hypothetical protein